MQNIPEKYRYRNYEKSEEQIFNYDNEGWPQYKQTPRDFLIAIGASYNESTNTWEISDSEEVLDKPISVLEDDGMGYGVNEKFVQSMSGKDCQPNLFIETQVKDIDIWRKAKFYPGAWVRKKESASENTNHYCLREIKEDEHNGSIIYFADQYCYIDDDKILRIKTMVGLGEDIIDYD